MKKTKHLIVLSLDGLSSAELRLVKEHNGFRELIQNGSYIENVETIYPSLTYPAHSTVVTGRYPKDHGIISNTLLQEGVENREWYWYRKYINGDTLYDAARRKGLKTASILWPVSAGAKINYNLPEVWATKKYESSVLKLLSSGSKAYMLDLQLRFGKLRQGIKQPYLDDFVTASTEYTIKTKKPNLMLVHLIDLDTQKHLYGVNSKEAKEALYRLGERIERVIKALKEAKIYDDTTIVAFGDHSQLNVNTKIKPNVLFLNNKLLKVDSKGNFKSAEAYFDSCDGSGYVYVKDKCNIEKVKSILQSYIGKGIENVYTQEEAIEFGANSKCTFMLEASKGYWFNNSFTGSYVEKLSKVIGQHGYSPLKDNYTTVFMVAGNGIKKGVRIDKGHIINHAKTLAHILDVDIIGAKGEVIKEIFNK